MVTKMSKSQTKRVVITGVGMVTPIGNDKNTVWNNLLEGRHGFEICTQFDVSDIETKVVGPVRDFDPGKYIDRKEAKRTDLYAQYAIYAALDALSDCGSQLKDLDPYRVGVIIGTGKGGLGTFEIEYEKFLQKGASRVSVFLIPMMISNMAAGLVAMKTGFKGANFAPVSACASGTHAIGEAFHKIKNGYLDACLAGGAEASLTKFSMAGFNNMTALARTDDPDRASIPFDAERKGFIMSDGSGMLVLEELEHAQKRGAHIYAEIVGYGATADAYHITSPSPDGDGDAKAMEFAVAESGLAMEDIDYINAHGTSTPLNDHYETVAIKKAFGDHAYKLAINSTKSMIGHLLGAAGAVEAIVTALSLENGVMHRTLGYQTPDPECDLDYIVEGTRQAPIRAALSNNLGFGGQNAAICLKKYEG